MTSDSPAPIYKAALTKYAMPFDMAAGARAPQIPDDPGIVHAVRPVHSELGIREPYYIEDTGNYRAALCGALVKVIMPNTFKTEEPEACTYCIAETLNPATDHRPILRPGGLFGMYGGDAWSPRRWFRKRVERNK
ncbi:hypothetical protein ACS5PJ_14365 [Pseudarthrobacter sp. YS3]|uniref:hypothetical protein n=1 Tax=Pseudarthrobacter sp. YS3 TaxID=3453718 RepID=UPI003EECD654